MGGRLHPPITYTKRKGKSCEMQFQSGIALIKCQKRQKGPGVSGISGIFIPPRLSRSLHHPQHHSSHFLQPITRLSGQSFILGRSGISIDQMEHGFCHFLVPSPFKCLPFWGISGQNSDKSKQPSLAFTSQVGFNCLNNTNKFQKLKYRLKIMRLWPIFIIY